MDIIQAYKQTGILSNNEINEVINDGLGGCFRGKKILVIIPDHTRTIPLPLLFNRIVKTLADTKQLDFLVALGTHPPLSEANLNKLVGLTNSQRANRYKHIRILNHSWDNPDALLSIGHFDEDEIRYLSGQNWHKSLPSKIEIQINKIIFKYDHILILGPVFPHEVVGFSGGAKYLFPGISGPEITNASHWLGALAGVVNTIGKKNTPVRALINNAAQKISVPISLIACVMDKHDLVGIFIGDLFEAWEQAVKLSSVRNIIWCEDPYKKVLSCSPPMYDELWTAAKAMYKTEPVVQEGGEVIIYAPNLDRVSTVHGKEIYEIGYHILPYFLANWESFQKYQLGVLAHSTHLRGSGILENGIEKPNVDIFLASQISKNDCERLNLKYLDPEKVNPGDYKDKEDEGILYVPNAGEKLYKIK